MSTSFQNKVAFVTGAAGGIGFATAQAFAEAGAAVAIAGDNENNAKAAADALIKAGKAKFDGDRTGFDQLRSILVPFTPDFEILPGTAPQQSANSPKPFEVRYQIDLDYD